MQLSTVCLLASACLPLATPAAAADHYWTYRYKDLEVTTAESAGRAQSLAHNIARFDQALTRILLLPDRHLSTHIYELPTSQEKAVLGATGGASYRFSGYDVTVVTGPAGSYDRNWGPLFGYTASLLVNGRALRSPYWFQVGVPQLFANTEFEPRQVKTGGMSAGFAQTLVNAKLIPAQTLLRIQANDPQLHDAAYRDLFEAECWFLAREIFVEGKLRSEFGEYLRLMRDGKDESEAFAQSFKSGYEELDKMLQKAMGETAHVFLVDVPVDASVSQEARRLSDSEAKALLANLNLTWNHRAEATRAATEALQQDARSELALSVLARANLEDGKFAEAAEAVDKLDALVTLSASGHTDGGEVLSRLAAEVNAKHAPSAMDADTLVRRATQEFEQAISLDAEYLRAWAGLAYLFGSRRDKAGAQSLVARAQPVMEKHPDCGALARALAMMAAQTGQNSAAFLFGEYWRNDAVTPKDRDRAQAFIAQLQAH